MRNWKLNFVFFLFLAIAAAIIVRLADLQIKNGSLYEAMASGQHLSVIVPSVKRGGIFLENTEICLAQNQTKTFLFISSKKILPSELNQIIEPLSIFLSLTKDDLLEKIQEVNLFKQEVAPEQAENLRNYLKQQNLTNVWLEDISARFYPYNDFASQLLGFVNTEGIGQYGLESYYNDDLSGSEKFTATEYGAEINKQGDDIFLTIDYNLQYFAEKLLKEAKEQWNIDSGQIVVEEPSSGRIFALANFPGFNNNRYGEEKNLNVFVNSVTQKFFEPGSVFKPIVMAAGLEEKIITPETKYIDEGFVNVGGKDIFNFGKRIWGEQTMIDVLEESINTGAVFVEQQLGSSVFWRYIKSFGFLEKTNIDLPSEAASANDGLKHGYPRDFATASFGQGIMITPLQLIRAYGALANNGQMMQPYIVEKIISDNGRITTTQPKIVKQVVSESTAANLTAMLISVVKNGAGRAVKIPGYYIAGKTGTAQVPIKNGGYSDTETIQSFIGYFPALNPKYLILIKLDNPKGVDSSGHSAAVIFHDLAKYIIDFKQIPPSPDLVEKNF